VESSYSKNKTLVMLWFIAFVALISPGIITGKYVVSLLLPHVYGSIVHTWESRVTVHFTRNSIRDYPQYNVEINYTVNGKVYTKNESGRFKIEEPIEVNYIPLFPELSIINPNLPGPAGFILIIIGLVSIGFIIGISNMYRGKRVVEGNRGHRHSRMDNQSHKISK